MKDEKIIQLMRPSALGDLLMCTSTFPALKESGYAIRFVVDPGYAEVLSTHPLIDELVVSSATSRNDVMADTSKLPAAERYVYFYYPFYTKQDLPAHPIPMHLCAYFCEQAGVEDNQTLSVGLSDEQLTRAAIYRDKVLIHTESRWSPYKNWPADRWAQLAKLIRKECDTDVFQIGGPEDGPIEGIEKLHTPSILDAIAAVKQCRLLFSIDSVFNHASRAVNRPSIIIWGSTHPAAFGYRQNINLVNGVTWQTEMGQYGSTLNCQPCYREYPHPKKPRNPCPYTVPYPVRSLPRNLHKDAVLNACMSSNTVEIVFHHARRLLMDPHYVESLRHETFGKNREP